MTRFARPYRAKLETRRRLKLGPQATLTMLRWNAAQGYSVVAHIAAGWFRVNTRAEGGEQWRWEVSMLETPADDAMMKVTHLSFGGIRYQITSAAPPADERGVWTFWTLTTGDDN
ncbi:MAG: hypothetical protein U0Z53_29050 [Blastocatellia bacterium]